LRIFFIMELEQTIVQALGLKYADIVQNKVNSALLTTFKEILTIFMSFIIAFTVSLTIPPLF